MQEGVKNMGLATLGAAALLSMFRKKKTEPELPPSERLRQEPTPRTTPIILPYLGSPELPPGFRLLQLVVPNLTGRDVRAAQQALYEAGVYHGPVHGVFDYDTAEAVKAFQAANELQATGVIDVETWLKLGVLVRSNGEIIVAPRYVVGRVR